MWCRICFLWTSLLERCSVISRRLVILCDVPLFHSHIIFLFHFLFLNFFLFLFVSFNPSFYYQSLSSPLKQFFLENPSVFFVQQHKNVLNLILSLSFSHSFSFSLCYLTFYIFSLMYRDRVYE